MQWRRALVELPDLAVGAPEHKATAHFVEMGARGGRGPSGTIKSCSKLVRDAFFCPEGDEAVLLDQVTCELDETITRAVTVKARAENRPEPVIGLRDGAAHPVPQADVHHAAQQQAKQMQVGKVGG